LSSDAQSAEEALDLASSSKVRAARSPHCFAVPDRIVTGRSSLVLALPEGDRAAIALATLLPLLGCGEEAASLAFDGLAHHYRDDDATSRALTAIARDERVHDVLIGAMLHALPDVPADRALLQDARHFHIVMARGGSGLHLARIAALDAAVCVLLGRLLREGRSLAVLHMVAPVLNRIRNDEARHVRLSRRLALDLGTSSAMRDVAAEAREALADMLSPVGEALEVLGVDAGSLDRDIRRLPDGLLVA
jgi:hypothetical protein